MKIHAAHCGWGHSSPWTHQYEAFRHALNIAAPALHAWTDNPEEADHIFLTNDLQPDGRFARHHPLLGRYPEKCLLLDEQDQPDFILAGIYACAAPRFLGSGRIRTGSYNFYHPDFGNPFVSAHTASEDTAPSKRTLLASFQGRNCHPIRARLFSHTFSRADILIKETSSFNAFTHDNSKKRSFQEDYYRTCLSSKFILCPRGNGASSIRLFESLKLGIAPVIITDHWLPCEGPDWSSFALFVPPRKISALEEILTAAEPDYASRGKAARRAYQDFFSPEKYANFLIENAKSIRKQRLIPETLFVRSIPLRSRLHRMASRIHRTVGSKFS